MFAKLKTLVAFTIKQLSDKFTLKYFRDQPLFLEGEGKNYLKDEISEDPPPQA